MHTLRQINVIPLILLSACADGLAPQLKLPQDVVLKGESKQELRPLTIDDLLAIEDTGQAASSHDGSLIVYEKTPPYVERPDFGVAALWPDNMSSVIYAFEPNSTNHSRPLFAAEKGTGYWLASSTPFSPDDDYLALYSVNNGRVSIAAFDVKRRRLIYADNTPDINLRATSTPIWVDRETLVFAALPEGEQPEKVSFRRYTGEQFYKAWKASWTGDHPSYREITNISTEGESPGSALDGQLIAFNVTTGETRLLANGNYVDLQLSADGRYLAALKQSPKPVFKSAENWMLTRTELVVFDLSAGRTLRPAPEFDVFPRSLAWSPCGSRLAFFGWPSGKAVRAFGTIHVFDAYNLSLRQWPHTGLELASRREVTPVLEQPERFYWVGSALAVVARPLPDRTAPGRFAYRGWVRNSDPAKLTPPDWVLLKPDGKQIVLSDDLKGVSRKPLAVTGEALIVLADGAVWSLSSTGVKKNLSAGYPDPLEQPEEFVVEHIGGTSPAVPMVYNRDSAILEKRTPDATRNFVFVTLDEQVLFTPVVTNAEPSDLLNVLSASDQTLFIRSYRHGGGSDLLSLSTRSGEVRRDAINEHMKDTEQEWKLLKYRSSISGDYLESCMLLPVAYEAGHRYPAIINVYPSFNDSQCVGPQQTRTFSTRQRKALLTPAFKDQLLAANGYIVVRAVSPKPEQRNTTGPLAGLPTLMTDAANALVEQGFADPNRIGLFGFSQGGAAVLWVAVKTNQFKAVVAMNGFADYWSHYFQADAYKAFYHATRPFGGNAGRYEPDYSEFGLGVSPFEDPEAYIRNSPIFYIKDVTTPILLINSDMDAFPTTQYEQMYTALLHYDKPAKLITYWGEGHILNSPANIRHMWESVLGWYGEYLQ